MNFFSNRHTPTPSPIDKAVNALASIPGLEVQREGQSITLGAVRSGDWMNRLPRKPLEAHDYVMMREVAPTAEKLAAVRQPVQDIIIEALKQKGLDYSTSDGQVTIDCRASETMAQLGGFVRTMTSPEIAMQLDDAFADQDIHRSHPTLKALAESHRDAPEGHYTSIFTSSGMRRRS